MLRKFFSFFIPTYIGYRYTTRLITDANDRQFILHIIDEQYRFCGIVLYNESFGFEVENELWEYVFINNIELTCIPDVNNFLTYKEQQSIHYQNS